MNEAEVSWGKSLELAQRGFDRWAAKPHNKKWVRRIDGTPIGNDLLVCIAWEIERGFRETPFEERQARIYTMERRIRNQRKALHDTWEIVENRSIGWMGSPGGRRRFHFLLKHCQEQAQELRDLRANRPPPLWRRLLTAFQ